MKIRFLFEGCRGRRQDFKSESAHALFQDYADRISHFGGCEVSSLGLEAKKPGTRLWLCDASPKAKAFSSEALSRELGRLRDGGVRELAIGIGDSDGFGEKRRLELAPDLLWNFGPMTLPHELAAIVAAEQLYRAFTILQGVPYHK